MSVYRELIYELAQDMEARGLGVFSPADPADRNIFIGQLPDEIENEDGEQAPVTDALLLLPVPSPAPHQYIDTEYPVIDIWARSPHSDRAIAMLHAVQEQYHRDGGYSFTNWHIYFSRALGTIVDVDRDTEGGKLFRLSVQFLCRNLNHVS